MACGVSNTLVSTEIRLGIERILVSSVGASWSPFRVDIDFPPSGFTYLGAVDEEQSAIKYNTVYFDLPLTVFDNPDHREIESFSAEASFELLGATAENWSYAIGCGGPTGSSDKVPYGTHEVYEYSILGVADLLDGSQVVHYFPRVTPKADTEEKFGLAKNSRVLLKFDALPVETIVSSLTQVTVGHRYTFDPNQI